MGATPSSILNVAGINYQVRDWFATESNTSVAVCLDAHGKEVIVKVAGGKSNIVGSGSQELQLQALHLNTMHRLTTDLALYPRTISLDSNGIVLPYFPQGSLRECLVADSRVALSALSIAIDRLFFVSNLGLNFSTPDIDAWKFLRVESEKRIARTRRVIRDTSRGRIFADLHRDSDSSFGRLESGLLSLRGNRAAHEFKSTRLGLAAHGDFVPGNIVLATSDQQLVGVKFIDLRGDVLWSNGIPWWDPIMDLAGMILHLSSWSGNPKSSNRVPAPPHQVSQQDAINLCLSSDSFRSWIDNDGSWQRRLPAYLLLKSLGRIAFSIVYSSDDSFNSATDEYCRFVELLADFDRVAYD